MGLGYRWAATFAEPFTPPPLSIVVTWEDSSLQQRASELALFLRLPAMPPDKLPATGYVLRVTQARLLLEWREEHQKHELYVEFLKGPLGFRRKHGGGLKQAICRAVGIKSLSDNLKVVDGTAGLGRDAFILACQGCEVTLLERSPILFALLQDGWKRASQDATLGPLVKKNMHPLQEDLRTYLKPYLASVQTQTKLQADSTGSPGYHDDLLHNSSEVEERRSAPDVIYLDPMFPPRKKSALTKMEMRIIRDIVGKDEDADVLLTESLKVAKKRVVVKRPAGAPNLNNLAPDMVVSGKTNRYDVYLTQVRRGYIKIHE